MAYKQKHQYGFRDSLEKGDPEKVIYGQYFDDEFKSIEEAIEAIDPDSDGNVDINEIDGLQDALDGKADKDHTHDEYLTDAPNDGKQYVRESEAWAEVTIPEAGIDEPTSDGKPYSRKVEGGQTVGAWVEAPTTDDIEYLDGRIDAIEGNISGGGGFIEAPDDGDDYARNGKSPAWVKTYNADYIDALEADYKNADAGKADKDHNHDSDYAPIDHTHTTDEITGLDDKIAEIEGDITDLEGAVGELTGQLALGGSYNASTGLVVTANLSSFTAGQPLPDYSTVPNTFVIVVEAGNNPEELGEGDWLVAGQSGWVAIKYGTAGSVDWDNISNVPDFDLAYAPIDHTHEIADVDGLQEALDAATGESLWTQNGDDIYYSDGNVGIGTDSPAQALHINHTDGLAVQIDKGSDKAFLYHGASGGGNFSIHNQSGGIRLFTELGSGGAITAHTEGTERFRIDANGNAIFAGLGSFGTKNTGDAGVEIAGGTTYGEVQSFERGVGYTTVDLAINSKGGRVGIGGQPSRSTKEIEEEAEATLRNWDSKDKKPTKAELIKKLAERNIGGGSAKLQVAGDGYFSGNVNALNIVSALWRSGRAGRAGLIFTSSKGVAPTNDAGNPEDGTVDLGQGGGTPYRFKDGHFSGALHAGTLVTNTHVLKEFTSGLTFQTNAIVPLNSSNSNTNGQVDLGSAGVKFKDAYFSGAVNAATINGKVTDVPDHVKAITPTQIANWDAGTGGGGGATTDGRISDTQITNWDTAYGWGNHASAGYAKGSFVPTSGNTTISGTLTATDFVATSDARLKQNATTAPVGLVDQLRGVEFEWKEDGRQDAGVIAQEVEKVLPHLVHDNGEHKAVNYNGLVAYLIEEIKNLKAQVEALK